MAKKESEKPHVEKEESADGEPEIAKKRFGRKVLLVVGGGVLAFLLTAGGGAYFFFFSGKEAATRAGSQPPVPLVAPQVAYYDMSDIVVNIQSADGSPAYLKLSVALELDTADEKAGLQTLMPRVADAFQGYLRELRVDDLHGSAGVLRLKDELLRRVNVAAAPFPVRDVLLKEMIVQ